LRVQAYFGTDLYVRDNMTFDQAEVRYDHDSRKFQG
jgi:hypothetical protein